VAVRDFRCLEKTCVSSLANPLKNCFSPLKVKTQLRSVGAWCHVVGSAERGQEIVKRDLVREVDGSQLKADLVLVTVENVVMSYRQVEEMTWSDSVWIVIGVVGAGFGDGDQRRSVLGSGTETAGTDGSA